MRADPTSRPKRGKKGVLAHKKWLVSSLRLICRGLGDDPQDRSDPNDAIVDTLDPRHILGRDAQHLALLVIDDRALERDHTVGHGDLNAGPRRPGGLC